MKRLLAAIIATATIPAIAAAADANDWVIVTSATGDGGAIGAFLVDKASIKDGGDGKHADVMLIAKDQYADYLMVLDCSGNRWSYTAAKVVSGDGKPEYQNGDGWADAAGTPMGSVVSYVCSNGTKAAPVGRDLGNGDPVAATRAWIASGAKL